MDLKRLYFIVLMTIVTALAIAPAKGQELTLTLDDAIKAAIDSNYSTRIALMEVTKAQAAVDEAFGYALPTVDLTGNYGYFIKKAKMPFPDFETMLSNVVYGVLYKEFPDPDFYPNGMTWDFPIPQTELMEFAQSHNLDAKAQLTQIIFNSAVFNGIGASQVYLDMSKVMARSTMAKNINDIQNAFYGVLLAQEMLEITRENYENAKLNVENVTKLHEQGLVSDFDMMSAEVQVENINPAIKKLENAVKAAKDGLKMLLGLDQSIEIKLEGNLTDAFDQYSAEGLPDLDKMTDIALKDNFDLRTLSMKKHVDKAFVDVELSDYWPTVAAFANYSIGGMGDEFNEIKSYKESMVGLSFSINLFRGRQTKNRVQQKKIEVEKTQQQIDQLYEFIKGQIETTILELQRVNVTIESQERNVDLAQRAYELAEKRFKEGTGTQLEIKNANMELKTAKTNKLQSIYDYIVAYCKLKHLTGKIDDKYLNELNKKIEERVEN